MEQMLHMMDGMMKGITISKQTIPQHSQSAALDSNSIGTTVPRGIPEAVTPGSLNNPTPGPSNPASTTMVDMYSQMAAQSIFGRHF